MYLCVVQVYCPVQNMFTSFLPGTLYTEHVQVYYPVQNMFTSFLPGTLHIEHVQVVKLQ